jgi:hypothetical protein
MAGSCSKAIGGVADVRSLALIEPVMKVAATNGYKKPTSTATLPSGSSYKKRFQKPKKRPEPVGAFS